MEDDVEQIVVKMGRAFNSCIFAWVLQELPIYRICIIIVVLQWDFYVVLHLYFREYALALRFCTAALGGPWRPLKAPGGAWQSLAARGAPWRALARHGAPWWPLVAPAGSWRHLVGPGGA